MKAQSAENRDKQQEEAIIKTEYGFEDEYQEVHIYGDCLNIPNNGDLQLIIEENNGDLSSCSDSKPETGTSTPNIQNRQVIVKEECEISHQPEYESTEDAVKEESECLSKDERDESAEEAAEDKEEASTDAATSLSPSLPHLLPHHRPRDVPSEWLSGRGRASLKRKLSSRTPGKWRVFPYEKLQRGHTFKPLLQMDGSRFRSAVWQYFSWSATPGKAVCKTCNLEISMGATMARSRNTTNMWNHLRIHHPDFHKAALLKRNVEPTSTVLDMVDKQRTWTSSENRSKLMDKLIIEMIVTDNQPFSVVSDVGFKRLMAAAEPRYALKSERYYRTEKLHEVHHKVVDKIKAMIQPGHAGYPLSFTTDCWSGGTECLMTLTCHFVDNEWTRRQVVLNTRVIQESQTGEYLEDTFLRMLEDWKISGDRVTVVLRDSGANIMEGMRLAELPDLRCTAHALELVVHDGLTSQRAITDIVAMLKRCATHFHHSPLAKRRLRNIQRELGLPEHNITQAVPMKWKSTLHMLQRMLEQRRALDLYCGEHGGFSSPTAQQWDLVSALIQILLPIEEVTLQVSHSNSSASCIIPCLTVLKMLLQDKEGPPSKGIGKLRQAMRESLEKRFSKLEDTKLVVLACLLDPRYKSHAFSVGTTLSKAKTWLKEEADAAVQQAAQEEHAVTEGASMEEQATTEEGGVEEQAVACGTHGDEGNPHKRQQGEHASSHSRVDEMFTLLLASHTDGQLASSCFEDELYLYLKEPVIDRRTGEPLQWWRQNEERFKQLAKLARKFLCAPPSSVPSERVFSEASAIHERKRSRLTEEHAEQLCFLHHNLMLLNWDY